MTKRYFYSLDGIRGLAAALVVLRHTPAFFGPVSFQESYLAVDIFFVLSGVVLANAYESRLQSTLSVARFMWIRLARLYPLYILGTAITVFAVLLGITDGTKYDHLPALVVLALLMLPNVIQIGSGVLYPLNNPAWSLFFELVANAAYATIARRLTAKMLSLILALSAIGLMISLYIASAHSMDMGGAPRKIPVGLVRVGYSFFAGIACYRIFTARARRPLDAGRHVPALIGVLCVIAIILMSAPSSSVQPYFDFLCVTAVFPVITYLALWIEPVGIAAQICKVWGTISYALYALHAPVGYLVQGWAKAKFGLAVEIYAPEIGASFLVLLMAACWIADTIYDWPFRRLLLRVAAKPRSE